MPMKLTTARIPDRQVSDDEGAAGGGRHSSARRSFGKLLLLHVVT